MGEVLVEPQHRLEVSARGRCRCDACIEPSKVRIRDARGDSRGWDERRLSPSHSHSRILGRLGGDHLRVAEDEGADVVGGLFVEAPSGFQHACTVFGGQIGG